MTPRDFNDLYGRLLLMADQVMHRPFDPSRDEKLEELRVDVDRAVSAPSEHRLMFDHERLLVQALQMAARGKSSNELDHGMAGAQIAGVLIPWVQEHAHAAMLAERARGTVSTSDGADYVRRR